MNENFILIIQQIIKEHGEAILACPQRLKGFVRDLAGEVPKPIRLAFGRCIEAGAYNALKSATTAEDRHLVKAALARNVHEEEGLDISFCHNALDIIETVIYNNNLHTISCKKCGNELQKGWISCPYCGETQIQKPFPVQPSAVINPKILSYITLPFRCYFNTFKNYAVFEGRSNRTEFWWYFIFNNIICLLLTAMMDSYNNGGVLIFSLIYLAVTITPNIALFMRRMHDINKSGWHIIVPFYSYFLALFPGTKGDNKYGPIPKTP